MKNALVVPGVFFLSFLSALAVFAFFGGLAECYGLTLPPSELAGFLMLCIVRSACYTLPIAAVFAIIGVYAFLLRHRAKLSVAVSLFLLCLVFTAIVIIPAFYAQASSVETALAAFTAYAPADTAVTGFIDQPFFLTPFIQSADALFNDLYSAYRSSFAIYLFFIFALFLCMSSFRIACTATRWNMLNLLLLFILAGAFLLLYPYMRQEGFQSVLSNAHLNFNDTPFGIPIVLCIAALILYTISGLKSLVKLSKAKRRTV